MVRLPIPQVRAPARSELGLLAGLAALTAGGLALGLQLERRIVAKRLDRDTRIDDEPFFSLRSFGPTVTTPDGVELHTEIDEPDGPTRDDLMLVFVHGYALNLDNWHFQRKHYRGVIRQIFYDQRSHGRSSRSAPELCRIPQLADDLAQVVEELTDGAPVVLIGHSMGAMTIMHLAQTRSDLFGTSVLGVGLFSTAAGEMADYSPISGIPGRAFSRLAPPLMAALNRIPTLVDRGLRSGSDIGYAVTKRWAFGSNVPADYVEYVSEMLAATPLEVIADFYPAFAELDEYVAFETIGRVETLVVGGVDDLITPISHTERMGELLPHTDTISLPECGHLGMIEHAGVFNDLLDDLLERVRRVGRGPLPRAVHPETGDR